MWPVTGGTDEDRKARVDAWAARHGIKAGTDTASGHYKAVLSFGLVRLEVYMIPERMLADRVKAANDRLAVIYDALGGPQPSVREEVSRMSIASPSSGYWQRGPIATSVGRVYNLEPEWEDRVEDAPTSHDARAGLRAARDRHPGCPRRDQGAGRGRREGRAGVR